MSLMKIAPAKILLELYEADTDKYFDDRPGEPIMGPPLVGVADAADPWFERFKQIIGDFHWTPQEALTTVFPEARARSVICWSLPVSKVARKANRIEDRFPAVEWSYARNFSTVLLERLEAGLVGELRAIGFATMGPTQSPENDVSVRHGVGMAARWSERHAAFVAGLGTFGISGGLITSHGIAHRLGSVVTEAEILPTPRSYGDDPFTWCLRASQGACGACIQRCPVGSVGETVGARDKASCNQQLQNARKRAAKVFGFDGRYGCGLCQTGVPCEDRNPSDSV